MKKSIALGFACVVFGLTIMLATSPAWSADTVRIQCVGDSITAGYTDNPTWSVPFEFGYRSSLYTGLTGAGYNVQYVGASAEPWNGIYGVPTNTPSPDLRNIGGVNQDKHRGYGGWGTASILSNINGWLTADNPDIILLMIGINDISGGQLASAKTNLNSILNTIAANKPNADVIVAKITPMAPGYTTQNADIAAYNSYIGTMVPTHGAHFSTVDQYANLLNHGSIDAGLFSNGINHPSNVAYGRMAQTWLAGIQAVHPVPEPSTMCLLATAGLALMGIVWRKRKN